MSRVAASLAVATALAVPGVAAAQPDGPGDEVVSPETLDALDDLDLLDVSGDDDPDPEPEPRRRRGGIDVTALSIDELATLEVEVASGLAESLMNAPGTIVVITASDIAERGYTSIDELFEDLPGFDVAKGRGTQYITVYGRGYRTPFTQRILFLVDGKVDNHLWTHEAELSRQYPMSNIERVEILYGPASAVYGPNAFTAIVNIVTFDGRGVADGRVEQTASLQVGSWKSRSVDGGLRGRSGDFSFAISGRLFTSDEPDLSGEWGFLDNEQYGSESYWGPILDFETADVPLGHYRDRTDDRGFIGSVGFRGARLGFLHWRRAEGYGPYYAADRVQNNALWVKTSRQVWLEHVAEASEDVVVTSLAVLRDNTVGGDWIEAQPLTDPGMEDLSYITKTEWLSVSSAFRAEERVDVALPKNLSLSAGAKYERKSLTKRYDIPGYYDAYSSQGTQDDLGPHGLGSHVGRSDDPSYVLPPDPTGKIGSDNIVLTHDIGGFAQLVYNHQRYRITAGVRLDHNSLYGETINPRVTGIYKIGRIGAVKLLYGEAFQEPAPIQLFGSWSGRLANPNLDPEKVRNAEAVFILRGRWFLHQLSGFYAHYDDVVKEEAENAGTRDIGGVQYDARFTLPNPIPRSSELRGYLNGTFTMGRGSQRYDHAAAMWIEDSTRLGDIAPIKANVGITVPVLGYVFAHVSAGVVSERRLYSRNPLSDASRPGGERRIDAYATVDANVAFRYGPASLALKALNITGADYFHPGVEAASSGDDFSGRSAGFPNSLLPQAGRSFWATLTLRL